MRVSINNEPPMLEAGRVYQLWTKDGEIRVAKYNGPAVTYAGKGRPLPQLIFLEFLDEEPTWYERDEIIRFHLVVDSVKGGR